MPKFNEQSSKISDNPFYFAGLTKKLETDKETNSDSEKIGEQSAFSNIKIDTNSVVNISNIFEINTETESEIISSNFELNINNSTEMSLTVNDFIKDAQRIHEFRGDDSYALSSFIKEVDTLLPHLKANPDVKKYVFERIILNKIQGEALTVLRTLPEDETWENIKETLSKHFGVKESYYQLVQQALSTRIFSVSEYYSKLQHILAKLNEKYCYDSSKPLEFSPKRNEDFILKIFLNNIDVSLASIIYSRGIDNLRESYNLLEGLGLIRENKFQNRNQNKSQNQNRNNNNRTFGNSGNNSGNNFSNRSNNFRPNSFNNNQNYFPQNNSHNYQNNYQNNLSSSFSNNFANNFQNRFQNNNQNFSQNNNTRSRMTRQTNNTFRSFNRNNNNNNQPQPMEVDFLNHERNSHTEPEQSEVNFQLEPPTQIYR